MSLVCKPAVMVPPHVLTLDETMRIYRELYADHPRLALVLDIARNTSVRKRHLVQPLEDSFRHPGVEERHRVYERAAKEMAPISIREALDHARLNERDIH